MESCFEHQRFGDFVKITVLTIFSMVSRVATCYQTFLTFVFLSKNINSITVPTILFNFTAKFIKILLFGYKVNTGYRCLKEDHLSFSAGTMPLVSTVPQTNVG